MLVFVSPDRDLVRRRTTLGDAGLTICLLPRKGAVATSARVLTLLEADAAATDAAAVAAGVAAAAPQMHLP